MSQPLEVQMQHIFFKDLALLFFFGFKHKSKLLHINKKLLDYDIRGFISVLGAGKLWVINLQKTAAEKGISLIMLHR